MPDPGDYIYVLIERTRQRSVLTVHQALPQKSYNKILANIITVYALISNLLYIIRKKKLYHLYHNVIDKHFAICVTTFRLKRNISFDKPPTIKYVKDLRESSLSLLTAVPSFTSFLLYAEKSGT